MTMHDTYIEQTVKRLTEALDNSDIVQAHHACFTLARGAGQEVLAQSIGRAWFTAVDTIFASSVNPEDVDDFDFDDRINDLSAVFETSLIAAEIAARFGAADELKAHAMDGAMSLTECGSYLQNINEHPAFELAWVNVENGQRIFFSTICLAHALEHFGIGFDDTEKRHFASHFVDWIHDDAPKLTEQAELLFLSGTDDAQSALFQKDNFPQLGTFMESLCSSLQAWHLDNVTRPSVKPLGLKRIRV